MDSWLERVKSAIPRGFSRHYVIRVLQEGPHTGKEIIDRAAVESGGEWKPSPGLIYPLLGRLLDEGLIKEYDSGENSTGRYVLTQKGADTAGDIDKIKRGIERQIEILSRLGNAGRFVAADVIERMAATAAVLGRNASRMTAGDAERYRQFLRDELDRMEESNKGGDSADPNETDIPVR